MFGWFSQKKSEDVVEEKKIQSIEPLEHPTWYTHLKKSLLQTRSALLGPIANFFGLGQELSPSILLSLKKSLIEADIGPYLTKELIELVRSSSSDQAPTVIKNYLHSLFSKEMNKNLEDIQVVMMVGVNGAGKTTTLAKIASYYKDKKPLLVAADTYRAAAVSQLQHWALTQKIAFFSSQTQDPAAVAFQALQHAQEQGYNISFIDTSGRLHNNKNLMQELIKIKRVILKKIVPEKLKILLVLDASQGQNMLEQVKFFSKDLSVDGLVVTKIDGSSKAGALFEVVRTYKLPIYFIGSGEKIDDLQIFDASQFIDALFGE
jgi:fused signal recognition particle receptor